MLKPTIINFIVGFFMIINKYIKNLSTILNQIEKGKI